MNTLIRTFALALALVLASATAAHAVAPSNDNRADATVIEALPFSDSVNIATATTEEGEAQSCGSQNSVWYRHTAAADGMMVASTAGSDFPAALSVYEGSLASMSSLACDSSYSVGDPSVVAFKAIEGRTYFFQAAKGYSSGTVGSQLAFALRWQPVVQTDIGSTAWTLADGSVTMTGVVQCSDPVALRVEVTLRQVVDEKVTNYAHNTAFVSCDGRTPWQANMMSTWDKDFTSTGRLRAAVDTQSNAQRIYQQTTLWPEPVRCTRIGTVGDDTMTGTAGADRICPLAGDDVVSTGGGDDIVYGYDGSDSIDTGRGRDTVSAGRGADTIELGTGNDVARGGDGRDRIFGEDGADTLDGNGGPDMLSGGTGSDTCAGGPGRDTFRSCERKR